MRQYVISTQAHLTGAAHTVGADGWRSGLVGAFTARRSHGLAAQLVALILVCGPRGAVLALELGLEQWHETRDRSGKPRPITSPGLQPTARFLVEEPAVDWYFPGPHVVHVVQDVAKDL